ncbi:uncharacterized protein LOC133743092 isoform X2 [Rosa rugosa]|uniref:uncharacterized protein LOC133743092 isoform X2 n=1 Tax=Rosa rugosa TaxID=74645 RepID=UPI002B4154E5|nr:uncharacterized protein LOC133743092 isoform X2 [Rosa rugosa]
MDITVLVEKVDESVKVTVIEEDDEYWLLPPSKVTNKLGDDSILKALRPVTAMPLHMFHIITPLELRMKPCYVVFVGLSAGTKACMYKVFQAVSVLLSSMVFAQQ